MAKKIKCGCKHKAKIVLTIQELNNKLKYTKDVKKRQIIKDKISAFKTAKKLI